jgi:hypothetical protein
MRNNNGVRRSAQDILWASAASGRVGGAEHLIIRRKYLAKIRESLACGVKS